MQIAKTLQLKPGMSYEDMLELVQTLQKEIHWANKQDRDFSEYILALESEAEKIEDNIRLMSLEGINLSNIMGGL